MIDHYALDQFKIGCEDLVNSIIEMDRDISILKFKNLQVKQAIIKILETPHIKLELIKEQVLRELNNEQL